MTRLLLLATLALAACADDPAPAPSPDETSTALTLGPAGAGRLGAETPFDTAAVRSALPAGFAVESHTAETERGTVPVVWALRDGLLVFEVYADDAGARVARIDVASDQVEGPGGARTGQTFAELDGASMDCDPGEADLSGRVVCRAGRGRDVRYVFAHAAAVGTVPDDDQLTDALLERMVWTAE